MATEETKKPVVLVSFPFENNVYEAVIFLKIDRSLVYESDQNPEISDSIWSTEKRNKYFCRYDSIKGNKLIVEVHNVIKDDLRKSIKAIVSNFTSSLIHFNMLLTITSAINGQWWDRSTLYHSRPWLITITRAENGFMNSESLQCFKFCGFLFSIKKSFNLE